VAPYGGHLKNKGRTAHGTTKDAPVCRRHEHFKTTAEVYMDHNPDSVRKAIDAHTDAIFKL